MQLVARVDIGTLTYVVGQSPVALTSATNLNFWRPSMHRFRLMVAFVAGLAIIPVVAVAGPKISTQAAPGVNFNSYKTYSWISAQAPSGGNPIIYQQIMSDIDSALGQKGYR